MKYLKLFVFIALLWACSDKKDTDDCYECIITWIITTDVPVSGYPAMTTTTHELCNVTPDDVKEFELTNRGSESNTVGNITYTSNYSTKCTYK